jgi:hypothetical protein
MVVKILFSYLHGTKDYSLCYHDHGNDIFYLHGFVDLDWVGDVDNINFHKFICIYSFGGAMSCMSKRQSIIALSSLEAN